MYKCSHCDRMFEKHQGLRVHISRIHRGMPVPPPIKEPKNPVEAQRKREKYQQEKQLKKLRGRLHPTTGTFNDAETQYIPMKEKTPEEKVNDLLINVIKQLLEGYRL